MFEKEAEEYANQSCFTEMPNPSLSEDIDISDEIKEAVLYGYNKANEWHFVKGGDLPKETGLLMSKTLLLVTKMKGSDCLSLALGEYNFSTQEFSYQHIVGLTDVITWKEIVLPKEIKENE